MRIECSVINIELVYVCVNSINTSICISLQYSQTPLHRASWNGHLHTVRLLLQRGVKMDSRDDVRHSDVHVGYGPSLLIEMSK